MKQNDPENYRNMLVPHESAASANAAIEAFAEGVMELRKQHRIADVVIVTAVAVIYPDGEEGRAQAITRLGNSNEHLGMVAYALGYLRAEERELISKLIAGEK